MGNVTGKYLILLRMREQSVAGLLSPLRRPVEEANDTLVGMWVGVCG